MTANELVMTGVDPRSGADQYPRLAPPPPLLPPPKLPLLLLPPDDELLVEMRGIVR
jgi:hypothetical protein